MSNIRKKRLKYRELMDRLKDHGVTSIAHRGKGSEVMLGLKSGVDQQGKYKGPSIPIKHHGKSTEYSPTVTDTILATFSIKEEDFWPNC